MIHTVTITMTREEVAEALKSAVREEYRYAGNFSPYRFEEPGIELVDGVAILTYTEKEEKPAAPPAPQPANPPTDTTGEGRKV